MTNQLTRAEVSARIDEYHFCVDAWRDGQLDDSGLDQAACELLFFDHTGVEEAAEIRRRADGSLGWLDLKTRWDDATLLHCRLRGVWAEIADTPWLGGDSVANVRGLFYAMVTTMTLTQAEAARRQLGL